MSIRSLHFSLILKIVFGRKVPMSSSLRVLTIFEILDGATFWSISTLISFCSLSDKSFWDSNMACSPRWGWWRWLKQLLVWRYHWLLFVRNNISLIGHCSSEHGARWVTHLLALSGIFFGFTIPFNLFFGNNDFLLGLGSHGVGSYMTKRL